MLSFTALSFNYSPIKEQYFTNVHKADRKAAAVVIGSYKKESIADIFPIGRFHFFSKMLFLSRLFSKLTYSYQVQLCWEVVVTWPKPVGASFSKYSK